MQIGKINEFKVVRKTDLGYMLTDGVEEILMHFNDSISQLNVEDKVNAFVFFDKKGRICATTKTPFVTVGKPGFVSVIETISNLGVFVDINTSKDVLVSKDYLPYDKNKWPDVDDKLLVELKVKTDTIIAKPLNRFEIDDLKSDAKYEIGAMITAYVFRIGDQGINLVTLDMKNVFVHKSMTRKNYRVGEMVVVKIVHENNGAYNGSLIEQKEKMIDTDAQMILQYLKLNNNKMHLDAKSSSEEIEALLHISRKAFKRALGSLYKERIVDFKDGYTIKIK